MSTTGLGTGSDFFGLNDALKQTYTGPFNNTIEGESEVLMAFQDAGDFEVTDGPDGKQINIGHYIAGGGGVSFQGESDYIVSSVPPVWKQGSTTIKQLTARVQLSGQAMRRAKAGPAAFATWAEMALPEKAKRVAFHLDRAAVGTGTGIIGRISGTPSGTGDAITSAYGITNLEGAINLFLRQDSLRYSSNSSGSSLRTGVVVMDAINYGAGTFNTTVGGSAGTATSAASGDYVGLGDANVNSFGSKEVMGLEGIVDDGTNLSTFQGLTRSSYPDVLNAQILDASTSYGGGLTEDAVDYLDTLCWERAKGQGDLLLANRNGQRSFWKSLRSDRVINDPQGAFKGGKRGRGLSMYLGDRDVEVRAARKVPSSRAYLIDRSTMKKFQIGAGRWDDTTGSIWNRVIDSTGALDAYFAVWIQELQFACVHPAKNGKIINLAAA